MIGRAAFALVALLMAGACDGDGPTPTTRVASFDGSLADSLVRRQVAFGPRVPGSAAHDEALQWMVGYLRERADIVELDPFTHVTATADTLSLTNVWASFQPDSSERILLTAHWDSRPVAEMDSDSASRYQPVPGANDGASGVAVLLAIADQLSRQPPGLGVDILLTDGEDWGHDPNTLETFTADMFLGARYFVTARGENYRPLFGILLDLIGEHEAVFPWEGFSVQMAPEVVRRVWDIAEDLGYAGVFQARQGEAVNDDHVILNEAGIRTANVIDFNYAYWHTQEDTPDKVSERTLTIVGDVVLTVIRRQGGQE